MKRTLAITAATALLALSLAGCGARDGGDVDLLPDMDGGGSAGSVTSTDTMRSGTNSGNTTGSGLGTASGAVGRSYGSTRYGTNYAGGLNNGGVANANGTNNADTNARRSTSADAHYALMLENGRVHDTDGFLLDGENSSWRTF